LAVRGKPFSCSELICTLTMNAIVENLAFWRQKKGPFSGGAI